MLTLFLMVGSLAASPVSQSTPAPNAACLLLNAQEIASLIGQTKTLPMMNTPTGSNCMFQNGDKMITVLVVKRTSKDAAKGQWDAKKAVSMGHDIAGWPVPAYSSAVETAKEHAGVVGVLKDLTFAEVRVLDVTQKAADLKSKLEAAMRTASGRM